MKVIKRYTAIRLETEKVNDHVNVKLSYGEKDYYRKEFDAEEEAIEYAHKNGAYATWIIVPVIRFDNFE